MPGPQGAVGSTGPQGPTGLQGATGLSIDGWDGNDGDMGPPGPIGPQGPAGSTGGTGPAGSTGPQGPVASAIFEGDRGTDGDDLMTAPMVSFSVGRQRGLAADARNWSFLGTVSGSTVVTVGPLIWTGQFQQFMFAYKIGGYSNTAIGRLLIGSASISTTGLTNGSGLIEGTSATTATSVPGMPLGNNAITTGRSGWGFIQGASGSLKEIDCFGKTGTPAPGTAPTVNQMTSFFSDLGTNLLIQRAQLTVYDLLSSTSPSANTFNSAQLWMWGRNND